MIFQTYCLLCEMWQLWLEDRCWDRLGKVRKHTAARAWLTAWWWVYLDLLNYWIMKARHVEFGVYSTLTVATCARTQWHTNIKPLHQFMLSFHWWEPCFFLRVNCDYWHKLWGILESAEELSNQISWSPLLHYPACAAVSGPRHRHKWDGMVLLKN